MPSAAPANAEFDRIASVTIQGGGVYGLSLLGQLQAVLDQRFRIVALAGTSAGAIVSALYWAGVPLEDVEKFFRQLAGPPNRITDLLGSASSEGRRRMAARKTNRLMRALNRLAGRGEFASSDRTRGEPDAPGREWAIVRWPVRAWQVALGAVGMLLDRVSGWADGGLFPGDDFERRIDDLIRESPRVKPHLRSGRLKVANGAMLTFGHLWSLMEGDGVGPREYFPALTLTATNLTTGNLELIDSTDVRHHHVPVATAVRASGGFPGFFTPVEIELPDLQGTLRPCRLVDGGVICNFPGFVFSRWTRVAQLGTHTRYLPDVLRPWVNIGLRLTEAARDREVSRLPQVAKRVIELLAGGGRTILESRLAADTVERYTPCEQPFDQTDWPLENGVLGFDQLTPDFVGDMFGKGRQFANSVLNPLLFDLPPSTAVEAWLDVLAYAVATAFGDPDNTRWNVRATLFVPRAGVLALLYRANMDDPDLDTDRDLVLEYTQGIVGYCFGRRTTVVCNLEHFAEQSRPASPLFGMTEDVRKRVRKDRTWLLSVPVFDPQTANPQRLTAPPEPAPRQNVYAELESPFDGGLFGILSVDAAFEYDDPTLDFDPDPDSQLDDLRVQLVLNTLYATAWELGKVFDASFGISPEEADHGQVR